MSMNTHYDTDKGIIAWFVTNPVAANLFMIAVIVLGYLAYDSLRREDFPVLPPNSLSIFVQYESGSASMTETGIALKIEEAIQSVQGIKKVTSVSTPLNCVVTVEKANSYDMDTLLRDVKNKVDAIHNFPPEAQKPVVETSPEKQLAVYLQVYADRPAIELQEIAEELRIELLGKSEINDAELVGKTERMISIELDENTLQSYGLTLADVTEKINSHSYLLPSATLRNEEKSLRIKAGEQDTTIEDYKKIPLIEDENGVRLLLGDVAKVHETFQDTPSVLVRFNGVSGVAVAVYMNPSASVTKVIEQVNEVKNDWEENGLLPHDVSLTTWDDASRYITERLILLQNNILQGMVLVFIVLFLFINVRIAFWVALSLPFIFLGTFVFMGESFFNLSLNEITTFGFIMALGIIVDDAVVVGESVENLRLKGSKYGSSRKIAILGTRFVAIPTIFGVLTTVATFFPLSFVSGEIGQLFGQFALVVSIALILSMAQSKLILPAHLAKLPTYSEKENTGLLGVISKVQKITNNSLEKFAQKVYHPLLNIVIKHCYAVLIILVAVFVLSTGLFTSGKVQFVFFPSVADNLITAKITMNVDSGYGLAKQHAYMLERTAIEADNIVRKNDESIIESIFINSSNDDEVIALIETKSIEELENSSYSIDDFIDEWKKHIGVPEGSIYSNVSSTVEVTENFTPELSHNNKEILLEAGEIVLRELQLMQGVLNVEHNLEDTREQWQIEVNESGYALGLTNKMVHEQIFAMLDGIMAQSFSRNQDEIDVKVSYINEKADDLASLQLALIRSPKGEIVPLSAIADISIASSEEKITRIDSKRIAYFSVLLDKSTLSAADVQNELIILMEDLSKQYPGLSINYGGETEDMEETLNSLMTMFSISMLVVYILLAIPLKSYFQPFLIMSVIPFGFVGAFIGHWLTSYDFSIMSAVGAVALAGVIINNSLLLITAYNHNIEQGDTVLEAIGKACISRLRPILLTSTTTYMGLVPLLSNSSEQAKMLIPAATSLAYGILFGTVITLILIPALLKITSDMSILIQNIKRALQDFFQSFSCSAS